MDMTDDEEETTPSLSMARSAYYLTRKDMWRFGPYHLSHKLCNLIEDGLVLELYVEEINKRPTVIFISFNKIFRRLHKPIKS